MRTSSGVLIMVIPLFSTNVESIEAAAQKAARPPRRDDTAIQLADSSKKSHKQRGSPAGITRIDVERFSRSG